MAIFHYSIKIIGRSSGKSAIASAAYRSGTKLFNEELQKKHNFSYKKEVVYSEILLPEHAPVEYSDRERLWNEVQKIEKASNAQLARDVEFSLPCELSREQQIALLKKYVQDNFVSRGMIADINLHDKDDGNPHAHIMLTTRGIKANGQWEAKEKKDYARDENGERIPIIDPETGEQKLDSRNRKQWQRITVQANDWNSQENAELWRANWAKECNKYLPEGQQIDHRSFARQNKEEEPTIHEGYAAREMEKRGEVSELCEYNRQVRARNSILAFLKDEKQKIENAVRKIKEQIAKWHERSKGFKELEELFKRKKEAKKEESTGYAVVDELLNKSQAEQQANNEKVQQLQGELERLRSKKRILENDLKTAKEILEAEASDDFVKVKVAEAQRQTLEERYKTKFDKTFSAKLQNTINTADKRIDGILQELHSLRPGEDFSERQREQTTKRTIDEHEIPH